MTGNFLNLGKDLDIQVIEASQLSQNFNLKQCYQKHITIKLYKTEVKENGMIFSECEKAKQNKTCQLEYLL